MKIISTAQMRKIEATLDAEGTSYETLMDRAGQAIATRALTWIQGLDQPRVSILVGPGNNGGDGLVAGLILARDHQVNVRFYLLKEREAEDRRLSAVREQGLFIALASDDEDRRVLRHMVASSDLVIDALFGTGVKLPLRAESAAVLRAANQALREQNRATAPEYTIDPTAGRTIPRAPHVAVLAADCPSGLNCDSGQLDKNAIHADETVTFIAAKPGLFQFPGASAVGKLTFANLGVSPAHKLLKGEVLEVASGDLVRDWLPERPVDGHKGTFGKALVLGGSVNYIGAPGLAASAAYRVGAGLVTIAAPGPVIQALAGQMLEPTWMMLPHDMGVLTEKAAELILKEIGAYQTLLIGPGLGRERTTGDFIIRLLENAHKGSAAPRRAIGFLPGQEETPAADKDEKIALPPLIFDADALNLLADREKWWDLLPANTILTPHPGEMARLAQISSEEVQAQRLEIAQEKAKTWHVILVLKGAHTVIAAPDGQAYVLPFKTDALASAGTGDVLAGMIAGFLAQGIEAVQAAVAGAYLHGLAGSLAASQSTRSVVASDLLQAIGVAFQALER